MFVLNFRLKISGPQNSKLRTGRGFIRNWYLTAVMIFCLPVIGLCPAADAKQVLFKAESPVVVIDPGHGGNDHGAQGPDGTKEKTVALKLASLIADQLENCCRVVLTRSDDYRLDISGRTAVANQNKADIFISLHTGASFSRSISGSTVYYYRQFIESALSAESGTSQSLTESSQPLGWDQIQMKYRVTSERLAKLIQGGLNDFRQTPDTKVQGAPLLVLQGADMPAVVIEIGNLSNPNEEKSLGDPQFLAGLAQAIAKGVNTFFADKPQ